MSDGFQIRKLGYSRSPWRITDAEGRQVHFEKTLMTIHGNEEWVDVLGYDTKADCIDALGRLAELLWRKVEASR